jgi:hypothetical protein
MRHGKAGTDTSLVRGQAPRDHKHQGTSCERTARGDRRQAASASPASRGGSCAAG